MLWLFQKTHSTTEELPERHLHRWRQHINIGDRTEDHRALIWLAPCSAPREAAVISQAALPAPTRHVTLGSRPATLFGVWGQPSELLPPNAPLAHRRRIRRPHDHTAKHTATFSNTLNKLRILQPKQDIWAGNMKVNELYFSSKDYTCHLLHIYLSIHIIMMQDTGSIFSLTIISILDWESKRRTSSTLSTKWLTTKLKAILLVIVIRQVGFQILCWYRWEIVNRFSTSPLTIA